MGHAEGDPDLGLDWAHVGVSPVPGSAGKCLNPLISFPASHYYKYKQQFIFPGRSLYRRDFQCGVLRSLSRVGA